MGFEDNVYELGFVFRGFILIDYSFRKIPKSSPNSAEEVGKDLRGAFISAISSFAQTAFTNTSLEYLESGDILFIFKMAEVRSSDGISNEPIILYCLYERSKKKTDKVVKKVIERIDPLLQLFIKKYNGRDFCEINQFEEFKKDIIGYFDLEEINAPS